MIPDDIYSYAALVTIIACDSAALYSLSGRASWRGKKMHR